MRRAYPINPFNAEMTNHIGIIGLYEQELIYFMPMYNFTTGQGTRMNITIRKNVALRFSSILIISWL